MKIFFLGTNGWFDSKTGNTPCVLVDTKDYYIIFDAGFGFSKLDQYIKEEKPIYLFLSHLHLDHIVGLHTLPKYNQLFKKGLNICGPAEFEKDLNKIFTHPFAATFSELNFPVKFLPIKEGENNVPFKVVALPIKHVDLTFGYRLEFDKKVVTYCSDTAYCENSVLLGKEVDILIHECTLPGGLTGAIRSKWGHSTPEDAANVAKQANAKKLYLTHFTSIPNYYPTLFSRRKALNIAKKIFKNTFVAKDDNESIFL